MRVLWYVVLGGALGSIARYLLASAIQLRSGSAFPIGTLIVNVTGSLALGIVLRYGIDAPSVSQEARALLATGVCGGYTTFSAFSYETAMLIQDGDWKRAGLYIALSVGGAVAGTFAGMACASELMALQREVSP